MKAIGRIREVGMFINPKTDFAFKKIFGSKQSTDILISFLNAMLYQGESTIVSVDILAPCQNVIIKGIEDSCFDVSAVLVDQRSVVIKIQTLNLPGYEKRTLYDAAVRCSTRLSMGGGHQLNNPIIALTIADLDIFPDSSTVMSSYLLREKEAFTTYPDDVELTFVELPKFTKTLEELESLGDKWLYFLRWAHQLKAIPSSMRSEPMMAKAFARARLSQLTRKEEAVFERQSMVLHDYRNSILYAYKKGEEEGRQEGQWHKTKIEIARRLLDVLDVETIAQTTGLTIAEIETLKLTI
jgi:predicted transposase/invertase (TIGR01784 family)